jgi:replicative DNA helicase
MTPNEATARQAELSLIAQTMVATNVAPETIEALSPDDFADARHGMIWRHIGDEVRGGADDAPSLAIIERMQTAGELELGGGFEYVESFNLWGMSRNHTPLAHCVEVIKQCARLRRIAATAKAAADAADGYDESSTAALVALRRALDDVEEGEGEGIKTAFHALTFDLGDTFRAGIVTRTPLDHKMPMAPGRMYVLGGRPGHGKTTLALQIAAAALVADPEASVMVASCEMSEPELSLKVLCCLDGRDYIGPLRSLGDAAMVPVQHATHEHADVLRRLYIKPTRSMDAVIAEAHRLHRLDGLTMLVVDYLSAFDAPGGGGGYENQTLAVGATATACKDLAQHLECVVLAASQLNRASKDSALPTLRGLRDSGVVEQAADGCLLLHRPDHDDPEGTAQLLIAKNRWGELGALDLVPDLQNHRFGWRSSYD